MNNNKMKMLFEDKINQLKELNTDKLKIEIGGFQKMFPIPNNLLLTEHKMLKTYYQCSKPLINAYNIQSMLKTFNQKDELK